MEKRHHTTLARTLIKVCFRRVLVGTLSLPFLLAASVMMPPFADTPQPLAYGVQPRPKELVKIYSIVKSNRPDISKGEAWELTEVIHGECDKHNLDPMLVLALIDVESKFQYAAVSPAGARGLMQILPYVGKSLLQEIGLEDEAGWKTFQPEFLDDPVLNIKLGVRYLKDMKKSFHDLTLALTAYNLGPTETKHRLNNDIEVSHRYATAVLSTYHKYKESDQATSDV
ncbi:MAG TPA: lytic transglycosylase domain-containing protein [Candidatus Binatia bacterium]|nr:lytic transglycosylase domain-containing protein [Candidatus Binatia bacterium]